MAKHTHRSKVYTSSCPACRSARSQDSSYTPATDTSFTAAVIAASVDTSSSSSSDCGGGSF